MKPNFYLELKIKNLDIGIPSGEGIPSSIILITGKFISALHAFNIKNSSNNIAISLPEYNKEKYRKIGFLLRLFSEERETLDDFIDYIESNSFISKHYDIRGVRKVNTENIIKYSTYIGNRIPKKLKIVNEKHSGLSPENYIKKCEYLHSLPNVRIKSSSNQKKFTLFIEKSTTKYIEDNNGISKNDNGELNSYGFSKKGKLIYLPEIRRI